MGIKGQKKRKGTNGCSAMHAAEIFGETVNALRRLNLYPEINSGYTRM